ncbi:putative pentatricopeptide repeat-containing protein At1g77010, mitochondrial [Miscanthus floridulus]|uniref:putative pentatricopeptide repeat-containing protein At1g77010, mitochondrial n=1 Tax=Miscanthus floridulus TaxID=154761 RepID=UPI003459D63B
MAVAVDVPSCIQLLSSCGAAAGRQLHQLLLKSGHVPSSLPPTNSVLLMYVRGSPLHSRDARRLFDEMPTKNCFSYNSLITSFFKSGDHRAALRVFRSMPDRNTFSWNAVITGLAGARDLDTAGELLEEMPVKDAVACHAVLHRFVRCGRVDEAFALLKRIGSQRNSDVISPWNDPFVLTTVVGACADWMKYEIGRQAHARLVVAKTEIDSVLACALIDMYCKCGDLDSARLVLDRLKHVDEFSLSALVYGYASCGQLHKALCLFDKVENPSIALWNSLISGCVPAYHGDSAFVFFVRMLRSDMLPNSSIYAILLNMCGFLGMLKPGQQTHACALKSGAVNDLIAASALIDFYSKCSRWADACQAFGELRHHDTIVLNSMITVYSNCGQIDDARRVFYMIPCKSVISWNSMIVGFSQNGHALDAMELFFEMHRLGLQLNNVAISSALSASGNICSVSFGEQMFGLAIALGLQSDHIVASSLIDLYCKCGNLANGCRIFSGIDNPDEVLWNSMLIGYAFNGYGLEALKLLNLMQSRGLKPSERTFVGVLSACCHSGLVEEGLRWFYRMKEDFGVSPSAEHYACVTDLLVRAGRLDEAVEFIENMPFKADSISWTSIIGACKAQGNEALLHKVANKLMETEVSPHSSLYVQLSSTLAALGDWDKSAEIRSMMHDRRISKNAGCSWIDRA